jgi:antitoxin component YwqK of YwqJK toxin-antitoxin module
MKYLIQYPIFEKIIDWRDQGIDEFREDVIAQRLPIFFDELVRIGTAHGIEIVDYETFYRELPDEHKKSAPPRGVPAFATVNPETFRPRVIINVPRIDQRLFDYIIHMVKHEMVHVGQWSRRSVHQAGPNPMDRAAYFSNKDEIMAFSQSIVDQLIAMGARTPQEAIKQLSSLGLYLDIKRNVDSRTLKRYHKYIYLYLEEELYTDLYEQVQPEHKVARRADGTIARESWYLNGNLHREDGPARISYRHDGTVYSERWYLNDNLHRVDGPAHIVYQPDGTIERERWYLSDELHRVDGPAWIEYRPDGTIQYEEWYLNGNWHREDGPAKIDYRPDGTIEREVWYWHGEDTEATSLQEFEAWKYLKSVGLV